MYVTMDIQTQSILFICLLILIGPVKCSEAILLTQISSWHILFSICMFEWHGTIAGSKTTTLYFNANCVGKYQYENQHIHISIFIVHCFIRLLANLRGGI